MISRERAIQILKEHWETERFVFQAEFHVPKNIKLREGTKPFGYFRNFRLNGKFIDYPHEAIGISDRRISIKYIIKNGLEDNQRYEVEVELNTDRYRAKNPFSLRIQRFNKIEENRDITKDQSLEKTINGIFQENINNNSPFQVVNLANSVESLATDIYSENKRFIYELIQNADDAAKDDSAELSIDILDDYAVISHNGIPFNSRDIRGLCSIGMGTKSEDATKTGYKGIGFKSVFGQPDGLVYVKTGSTLFRFDRDFSNEKSWNPKWGQKVAWEKENQVVFQCPWQMMPILSNKVGDKETDALLKHKDFTVKTAIKIKDGGKLFTDIVNLFEDAKFMLFLRRIKKVKLNYKQRQITIEKVPHEALKEAVSLLKNDKLLSSWYVKNWIHRIPEEIQRELKADPQTPKKIQSMEKTEISFALQLNDTYDEIQLLKENESALYSYLPTSVKEFNIPFIVNCNFLLDAGREKIHKNRKWNEWLFQVIGYKTVECCSEFAQKNIFNSTYLSILRNGLYNTSDNLGQKINAGLEIGFNEFLVVRNQINELCKLDAVYFDPFELNKLDSLFLNKITLYLNQHFQKQIKDSNNIVQLTKENKILKKFNSKVLNESDLQGFFASKFARQSITLDNNLSVLEFIRPFEEKDSSGKWFVVVTNHAFIINQDKELDYINGVCFPMDITSEEGEYKNRLIHESVYDEIKDKEELIAWLEKLGVTEPGSIAYLEKEIIGKIDTCISEGNFFKITKFILNLHLSDKLEENHYIGLQGLPLKTNKGLKKASQCLFSEAYNPTLDFSKFLENKPVISDVYLELGSPVDCRMFFKLLNVADDVDFIRSTINLSSNLNPNYVKECYTYSKEGHRYPHLIGFDYNSDTPEKVPFYNQTFSFFDELSSLVIAQKFWERLFSKFQLKKDKTGELGDGYEKQKSYVKYNLGNNQYIESLDSMKWGRLLSNRVYTLGYFFWKMENEKYMPTVCGMKLAKDSFLNTDYNKGLAGDFLPIINLKDPVPNDWGKVLGIKTKFSLNDLMIILQKISGLVGLKGILSRENEKRIGLIYNELLTRLESDEDNVQEEIKKWANNNRLVSNSKKSLKPNGLLWVKVQGFGNILPGIETILLPKNVDVKRPSFELLLTILGVKIIEEFSYQATSEKVIYDLKIKLLNLIGPIGMLLKNKLEVSNLDKYISERLQRIENTDFIACQNIHPVFEYESEKIKGEILPYFYDKKEDQFLLSINWKNPVSVLNISYDLADLLFAVKVEKELTSLLTFNNSQISDYLKSLNLDSSEYEECNSYEKVLSLIKELQEKMNPIVLIAEEPSAVINSNIEEDTVKIESEDTEASSGTLTEDEIGSNETDKSAKQKSFEYTDEEIAQIKSLFGRELPSDELEEENLYAQIKALRYFKDKGYDTSGAEANFESNFDDKYLSPIVDSNNKTYKVMCRSARRGILFLGAYAWKNLGDKNTLLYILTGDKSLDCILVNNQEELESELDAEYKVLRRKNTTSEELRSLIFSESNLSDLQLLYKVKGNSFDVIFNPQRNTGNNTEGPLTDIGEEI